MGVFEKAIIGKDEIINFIPQRAPIVMVDEFFGLAEGVSVSGLTVEDGTLFCERGVLDECGVIEHIAQSAALRMGYIYSLENKEIPLGYIGAIAKCTLHSLPVVGDCLRTTIRVEQEIMNISLITASVCVGERAIADCQMKIYLQS